ncbi:unnamed protein product [Angiostrongylus costaricensis]|uniref:Collagen type IV alpha-3-binding protein n=1 Tax=Angiostrongylus costaricensis TaxID=334426 RepID=A0A158PLF2_ANGCS|nr:unnamed protein product [Angiostrongylus costaricensis]
MEAQSSQSRLVLPSCGTLFKWTNYINGWRQRYFEIKHGHLLYYISKEDQASVCRGSVSIKSIKITLHEFNDCEFMVSVGGDIAWHLRAENTHMRALWVKALTQDSNDSDYGTNSPKTHSSNTSLSSLTFDKKDQNVVSRIAELEAYRTMCREQMMSLRRDLQQIGVPQARILCINATHIAMLDNINQIISLAKNQVGNSRHRLSINLDIGRTFLYMLVEQRRDVISHGTFYLQTSDCGDEWHDADEHSSLSFDSAEEAMERQSHSSENPITVNFVRDERENEQKTSRVSCIVTLLFGDYDNVLIPNTHSYYDLIDNLTKEQLRYALAGVEEKVWTLFAEDGAMKMYTREETVDGGLPIDPLKAVHQVKGVTALEFMHYFFDDKYKMEWDHTLNGMCVVERISRDTMVLHQKHKTVWPAASRESLFVSHIRRVDELKSKEAHDLYIVCNKDVTRPDVPVASSSVRVGLKVSMICETVIKDVNPTEVSRDNILCNIIYVSQVHPGGWVPTTALRHVYKKEYPKFLRTFTDYVLKNVKDKPVCM